LREYVDFGINPEELADRLTMAGLEVEGIEYRGKGLENIVVAEILGMRPHPDATKLSLCDVSDGERSYAIVCGASNMKPGDKVALARIGTELPPGPKFPEGLTIKKAKIRGEASEGMLCAENEIGLGEESDGIMILPPSSKLGARLIDELGLSDVIFEINVTPNRPDCLSVVGIAREVAAILGTELKYPDFGVPESNEDINRLVKVELLDSQKCPRYTCRVINNVSIGPSPAWLKTRLESSGVRSINNVVDVTNYVLLELGQPLHAFDCDLIEERKIVVRAAGAGEIIKTLDGIERKLTPEDLLICDGKRPVALAGVMGGANTEVSEGTKNILLESAYFDPSAVRKTSRKTGLKSESSYRFERGGDPNGVTRALDRAAALIVELSGGQAAKGRKTSIR
jgi:phenylalanyl-tRNA synthetase beta chain